MMANQQKTCTVDDMNQETVEKRAFTLPEVLLALLLLLTLAAAAIPTYQIVLGTARENSLDISAKAVVHELQVEQRLTPGESIGIETVDEVVARLPDTGTRFRHRSGVTFSAVTNQIRMVFTDSNEVEPFVEGAPVLCVYASATATGGSLADGRLDATSSPSTDWGYQLAVVQTNGVNPWAATDDSPEIPCS